MKIVTEFTLYECADFYVTVKAWPSARFGRDMNKVDGDKWNWNVYAHITEKHPLFNEPERCKQELYFHCGCTFDQLKTIEPSNGIKYDFQKITKVRTYGSDYSHAYDNYDNHASPADGIPSYVLADAETLVSQLKDLTTQRPEN